MREAARTAEARADRERSLRTAALEGFGVDLRELRKAMARVAAVADARAVGPGRASARAARCVTPAAKDKENARENVEKTAAASPGAALHAVLDRLAGMEAHLTGLSPAKARQPEETCLDYLRTPTPAAKKKAASAARSATALRANRAVVSPP